MLQSDRHAFVSQLLTDFFKTHQSRHIAKFRMLTSVSVTTLRIHWQRIEDHAYPWHAAPFVERFQRPIKEISSLAPGV